MCVLLFTCLVNAQTAMAAARAQEAAGVAAIAAAPAAAFNATASTLCVNVSLPLPPATELLAPSDVPPPGSAWCASARACVTWAGMRCCARVCARCVVVCRADKAAPRLCRRARLSLSPAALLGAVAAAVAGAALGACACVFAWRALRRWRLQRAAAAARLRVAGMRAVTWQQRKAALAQYSRARPWACLIPGRQVAPALPQLAARAADDAASRADAMVRLAGMQGAYP
jgi:hypothetical protein